MKMIMMMMTINETERQQRQRHLRSLAVTKGKQTPTLEEKQPDPLVALEADMEKRQSAKINNEHKDGGNVGARFSQRSRAARA